MYSRALAGYRRVVGHDDSRCQKFHDYLSASQTLGKMDVLADAEADGMQVVTSSSRRHRLLKKLGLRQATPASASMVTHSLFQKLPLNKNHPLNMLPRRTLSEYNAVSFPLFPGMFSPPLQDLQVAARNDPIACSSASSVVASIFDLCPN